MPLYDGYTMAQSDGGTSSAHTHTHACVYIRGVTDTYSTRRDTRLSSRDEMRFLDFFFFKSSMMKYIGKHFILFNWKTQNA